MTKVRSEANEPRTSSPGQKEDSSPACGGSANEVFTQLKMSEGQGARRRIHVANFANIALFPKPDDSEHCNLRSFRLRSLDSALAISDSREGPRDSYKPVPSTSLRNVRLSEQLRKFRHFNTKSARTGCSNTGALSSKKSDASGSEKKSLYNNNNYLKSAKFESNTSSRMTHVQKLITSAHCRPSLLRRFRVSRVRTSRLQQSCESVVNCHGAQSDSHFSVQKENVCLTSITLECNGAQSSCSDNEKSKRVRDATTASTQRNLLPGLSQGTTVAKNRVCSGRSAKFKGQALLKNVANKDEIFPKRTVTRLNENKRSKGKIEPSSPGNSRKLSSLRTSDDSIKCLSVNPSEQVAVNSNTIELPQTDHSPSLNLPTNRNVFKRNNVRNSEKNASLLQEKSVRLSKLNCDKNQSLSLGCVIGNDDVIVINDGDMSNSFEKDHSLNGSLCSSSYNNNNTTSLNISNVSSLSSLRSFRNVLSTHDHSIFVHDKPSKYNDETKTVSASLHTNVASTAGQTEKKCTSLNSVSGTSRSGHVNSSGSQCRLKIHDLKKTKVLELRKYRPMRDTVCRLNGKKSVDQSRHQAQAAAVTSKSSHKFQIGLNKMIMATNRHALSNLRPPSGHVSFKTNGKRVPGATATVHSSKTAGFECPTTSGHSVQQSYVTSATATMCNASCRTDGDNIRASPGLDLCAAESAHVSPTAGSERTTDEDYVSFASAAPGCAVQRTEESKMSPTIVPKRTLSSEDDLGTSITASDRASPRTKNDHESHVAITEQRNTVCISPTAVVCRSLHSFRRPLSLPNVTCPATPRITNEQALCTKVTRSAGENIMQPMVDRRALRQIEVKRLSTSGRAHNINSQYQISNNVLVNYENCASSNSSSSKRKNFLKRRTCRRTSNSERRPNSHYLAETSLINHSVPSVHNAQVSCANLLNGIEFIDCSALKHEPGSSQKNSNLSPFPLTNRVSNEVCNKSENTLTCNVSSSTCVSSIEDGSIEPPSTRTISPLVPHLRKEHRSLGHHSSKSPLYFESTDVNSVVSSLPRTQSSKLDYGSSNKLTGRASLCSLRSFRLHKPDVLDTSKNDEISLEYKKEGSTLFESDQPDIIVDCVVAVKPKTLIQHGT
ncbi:hypothetical protein FHG87_014078 [Trinorchestia longiramus]|nr:hypothetical protein FHG87_014078 [Trinorchestia longiramus]